LLWFALCAVFAFGVFFLVFCYRRLKKKKKKKQADN